MNVYVIFEKKPSRFVISYKTLYKRYRYISFRHRFISNAFDPDFVDDRVTLFASSIRNCLSNSTKNRACGYELIAK